ncbi:MAG: divergent PAP2 family protein [Clostridia bacterium]|nr:divergent PAP2 family protein [Clostridia bacterium]
MSSIGEILNNHVLFVVLLGWFVAQALKIPIHRIVEHEWDFSRFHGSGGMPSSHSSMVTAGAVAIGAVEGFGTPIFALAVAFAMVVMYDAAGVRRETGTQAAVINQILKDVLINGKQISDEELKELVGHTPLEVACGAFTGLIVAVVYLLIVF